MLNEQQKDALREYMGMYIGQAASLLSDMVEKRVNLTIPDIQIIDYKKDFDKLELIPSFLQSFVVSSSIEFGETFSGEARLIFPKEKIKELVKLCLGEDDGQEVTKLTDMDFDAIKEIGNIILNAIVGSIGNLVEVRLEYSIPEVNVLYLPDDIKQVIVKNDVYLLVIRNSFTVDETNIDGAIIVVLSMEAISELVTKIDGVLVDLYG